MSAQYGVFDVLGDCVTNVITWLGNVLSFITTNTIILIPMLMFFVVGGTIGVLMRLWKS